MFDLIISGGLVVDGMGGAPFIADLGVKDGVIVAMGTLSPTAKAQALDVVDATGCWVTPGFVDLHTHYDGQATWDETFSPSIFHGVTTLVMGNCGVGFAPLRKGQEDRLIKLMEGVEDIPGVALTEGVQFTWESFSQYMDALDKLPHSLDFLTMVPHDPLRMWAMGARAEAREEATDADIAAMAMQLREALDAGAVGFSTGRSDNHRTAEGLDTPASIATAHELAGIAKAFQGRTKGVVQVVSDFDLMQGPEHFEREFALVELLATASGRPLSMTWLQRDPGGEQYKAIAQKVEAAVRKGLPLYLQTAARGIGVINGLEASFHPFMGFPSYKEIASLPVALRAAAMRAPERKTRILSETSDRLAGDGTPIPPLVDLLLARIETIAGRMFALDASLQYEPDVMASFLVRAKQQGITALECLYDYFCQGDGNNWVYFPIFNYNDGNLDVVESMLKHPQALFGLGDAGAHVGTVCDASFTTFLLSHWVQNRTHGRLTLAYAVAMLTRRNAQYLGLQDRGALQVGLRADINIIDPAQLSVGMPELVRDLPAGGKRFLQKATGYKGTWVAGQCVVKDGEVTTARPGRLVRSQ